MLCFAGIAAAVVRRHHGQGFAPRDFLLPGYPWWVVVLIAAGELAGLALLLVPRFGTVGAAVALVPALQLAGMGAVMVRHAGPAAGMGGVFRWEVDRLEQMGVVIAGAGGVAALGCLAVLLPRTGARAGGRRAPGTLAGLAVAVLVPAGIAATSAEMRDVTSVGAMLLSYGLPWGVGLVAAGWLPRGPALAAALAVSGSVALGLAGPQMVDLVLGRSTPAFAAALVVSLLVLAVVAVPRPAPTT